MTLDFITLSNLTGNLLMKQSVNLGFQHLWESCAITFITSCHSVRGNIIGPVCVSVCLSVCLSVCALTAKPFDL